MSASDFLRVDATGMGGPCRDFLRHPGVKETGALTTGGIAVEEQRARRHAVTPFQFGCGTLKCRTGPLLRFPVVAVPERGGKQNQPVSISQIIEAETFQGIGPLPVATAEEYHDCLRLTCGESVCEFDSINKDIENQGLLRAIAEKNIDEAKSAIASKKFDIEQVKGQIAVKNDDLKAKKEELATIVESTAAEEAQLRAKRDACAAKIDARTMSAYERIRNSSNNKLAVVSVFNGDSCGGCFNTIPPQRLIDIASNRKMIICEYCGRILVNPDFE